MKEPLPGATIIITGTENGAIANADGYFEIPSITSNEIQLEVRSVGFKTIKKNYSAPYEAIKILLEESALDLNQVVVTGSMQPTFVSESPVKVEVVTARHLNTFLPAPASGVMESVQLINGVQEVVACGVCFTSNISINGLPGPYTAVLLDGTPMFGNLASVYGLNSIPNTIIDRVEVIKGPSSTLYGSEAVAGVINIITKDPKGEPLITMDLMATSHLETFGNISVAPKVGDAKGYVGLNYAYINHFDDENNDGFSDIINMDRVSLFSKWELPRKNDREFTIAGKYYYEDRRNGVREFLIDRNYKDIRGSDIIYGESIFTNRAELFGTYDLPVNFDFKVNYSLSHHRQNSYYGADFYSAEQNIAFANFIYENQISSHSILGGATLRYQDYDDNTVATERQVNGDILNRPDKQFIPGLFLQDEWKITKKFTLLGGMRLDNYEKHGNIFSPRLNIKVKPWQWTTMRLNAGTGFRIVNLFTEDHAFVTGQRQVVIEEELQPEESYNLAFNLNHLYTLGNSQGMIDFDAFYTYFTNKIFPDYETPGQIIYSNSEGFAISKGFGMNVNHEFTFPLAFNAGVNVMDVTETDGEGEVSDIEFAPKWTGIFTLNYNLRKADISFGYSVQVTGPMQLPLVFDLDEEGDPLSFSRPEVSSAFSIHNIQVNKVFSKKLSIYGGIQNIMNFIPKFSPLVGFNDPNANPGFSTHFDTAYSYAPIHGREYYLGLNFKIL